MNCFERNTSDVKRYYPAYLSVLAALNDSEAFNLAKTVLYDADTRIS